MIDTEEYYGGTYPEYPEPVEEKEDYDDYIVDVIYEEEKLGLR